MRSEKDWDQSESKDGDSDDDRDCHRAESKNSHGDRESAKASEPLDDAEMIERLQAYFFEDESLAKHFENFIDDHSHVVDLSSDEYKLSYTEVFNEYKQHFETRMEGFITHSLHCSVQDVYMALKKKMDHDENSNEAFFAQVLIAVTDFDVFMMMMRESAGKSTGQNPHK
jgi:hypothetical protein